MEGRTMRTITTVTTVTTALLLIASSLGLGCAFGEFRPEDPFKRKFSLEDQHKDYTDNVRWSKFNEASSFMVEDARRSFLDKMPKFEQVRFTDWEAEPWELEDEDMTKATIFVRYKGYSMSNPFEVEVKETQHWSRDGNGNNWTVESEFIDLDRLVGSS
jgi:hypothetical protein